MIRCYKRHVPSPPRQYAQPSHLMPNRRLDLLTSD
uniref:Uncharacterized protein n=1 Tax=Arundo donax TaxID=35708 RepID=A0A0A8YKR6_ARUDO